MVLPVLRPVLRPALALAALAVTAACGVVDYAGLSDKGRFEGAVLVLWVGENETGSGDGRFVYIPYPGRELVFRRDVSDSPDATVAAIRPGAIYTDGGSIPRAIQPLRGFSPWGYAPAYMIHDWLFVAHRCAQAGQAIGDEAEIRDMPFIESAEILGEAIKALVAQRRVSENDVAPIAISAAVAGPISAARWTAQGECVPGMDRLTPEDQAAVDGYVRARGRALSAFGVQRVDRERPGAQVVGVVEF